MQIIDVKSIPEIITLKIEKLSNLGLGIAKYNGYVIFTENACPGDIVKVKLTKKNRNYANAEVIEILTPSESRIEPFCKMQKVCGACQMQFVEYEAQLKYKHDIVKDTMHSIYGSDIEVHEVAPSPKIKEYRQKIQYPISETKDSKRILAGYYKPNSHELVNIKYCPIQPECCDKIIEFVRTEAPKCNVSGYIEPTHSGELRHIVIRHSALSGKSLVSLVLNAANISKGAKKLAQKIYTELPNIDGVTANLNNKRTNLILGNDTILLEGNDYIEESLCDKIFKVGTKTFFQVNPYSADKLFRYIKHYIELNFKSPSILDAYAGISAFGITLSDVAKEVISVEENTESVDLARRIIKENGINNLDAQCADAAKFFETTYKTGKKFDITILDPPRKGCSKESLDYALKLTKQTIIYVSCNPATLARDLRYLADNGAKPKSVQPFDMFPHTYHIENVAIIDL